MYRNPPILRLSPLLVWASVGCGGDRAVKVTTSSGPPAVSNESTAPPDSLAIRLPSGTEVWYTLAREDHDSTGAICLERILEIRPKSRKIPVPLLYTRDVPRAINDSTVSARVWNRCTPGDEYRVDLRTGQPVRTAK